MDLLSELGCDGVPPTGPVSAWPQERNEALLEAMVSDQGLIRHTEPAQPPGLKKMIKSLAQTTRQAVRHGKVSSEIREERYDTCKACPFFNAESKRCNDCGCFMEAKTWVGGDPDMLCPQKKWSR